MKNGRADTTTDNSMEDYIDGAIKDRNNTEKEILTCLDALAYEQKSINDVLMSYKKSVEACVAGLNDFEKSYQDSLNHLVSAFNNLLQRVEILEGALVLCRLPADQNKN